MCAAAAEHSSERFISVILHDRRVSFTLAKFPVPGRFDNLFDRETELAEPSAKSWRENGPTGNE
jgi:hypothetical protein